MPDLDDEELRATRKLNGVDICEGDYVRTDKGYIVKIDEDEEWFKNRLIQGGSVFGKALKHSPNLIDLIEVGDILKIEISKEWTDNENRIKIIAVGPTFTKQSIIRDIENGLYKIKAIVTHEQFNSVMYKVKE